MKPEDITPAHLDALLRHDFPTFSRHCFRELWPNTDLRWNWHLELICSRLDAVRRGECRRLIINVPPRSGKSLITSVALPAFLLGHDPTAQIVGISYAQELAEHFSSDCRKIMSSDFYRRIFGTRLRSRRPSVRELVTSEGGYRLATSIGGTLTGRGGNFLLLDDPQKPAEILSETQRKAAIAWCDSTFNTRLNDKEVGSAVLIMQRLHENDIAGHLIEKGGWEVLSLPAIAEEDEVHNWTTLFGARSHRRLAGDALHPERESLARLDEAKIAMGSYHFAAQYQQRPSPMGGGMIKIDWFGSFDAANPPKYERIVQSWDCASKNTELSDYSVCVTLGIRQKQIFLLSVYRAKLEFADLKRAVLEQRERFQPSTILVEDAAAGIQVIQELRREGVYGVQAIQAKGDKMMRMYVNTGLLEAGRLFLPAQAHWREEYLHEMAMFPMGKHDDQVDATAQALAWIEGSSDADAWIEYYRKEALKSYGLADKDLTVMFDHPDRNVQIKASSGRTLCRERDGYFRVTEAEWNSLAAMPSVQRIEGPRQDAP